MRLLINFTRSRPEGDERDEISKYWLNPQDDYEPIFREETDEGGRRILVIHGQQGNGNLVDTIRNVYADADEMGLLYHKAARDEERERGIRTVFPEDADFTFFSNYSESDPAYHLYENLAQTCRDNNNFKEEFDALWHHYAPDESLEIRLNLLHELLVPPATKGEIEDMGESLIEGVKNDPDASDEKVTRCEQAWDNFRSEDPQQYSDDPFNEKYCGSEDVEGMLEELRDKLLATAS